MSDALLDLDLSLHAQTEHRRAVLKKLAGGIAGSALLSTLPWFSPLKASPVGKGPADKVRVGLIGSGSRGQVLMEHLLRTPGTEIAALCDVYQPHLDEAAAKIGKPVTQYKAIATFWPTKASTRW